MAHQQIRYIISLLAYRDLSRCPATKYDCVVHVYKYLSVYVMNEDEGESKREREQHHVFFVFTVRIYSYSFPSLSLHYTLVSTLSSDSTLYFLCRKEENNIVFCQWYTQTHIDTHRRWNNATGINVCTRGTLVKKMLNKICILWRKSCASCSIKPTLNATLGEIACAFCAKASQQMKQREQKTTTTNTKVCILRARMWHTLALAEIVRNISFQVNDQSGLCVHSALSFYSISISSVPKANLWLKHWGFHERVHESASVRFFLLCSLCPSFFYSFKCFWHFVTIINNLLLLSRCLPSSSLVSSSSLFFFLVCVIWNIHIWIKKMMNIENESDSYISTRNLSKMWVLCIYDGFFYEIVSSAHKILWHYFPISQSQLCKTKFV